MRYQALYLRPTVIVGVALALVIAVTGIFPHDSENGDWANPNLPPFWVAPTTTLKQVVGKPETGKRHLEIPLDEAQEINPNVAIGDTVDAAIREGGSTEFLLGTDRVGRDLLSRVLSQVLESICTLVSWEPFWVSWPHGCW